jgi:hypothetical protein
MKAGKGDSSGCPACAAATILPRMICPRCGHERPQDDVQTYPGVCPACGVAYEKWLALQAKTDPTTAPEAASLAQLEAAVSPPEPTEPLWSRLYHYTCFMPSDRHESALWGHLVIWFCFVVWGWRFILHGVDWLFIGGSFLHNVNLPFHEYGHIAFRPFGEFWTWLGGSLFQILLPLAPLLAFMVWQRDNFAASIMLWWSGQNFIDVSPYIADAPLRALPLIGGGDAAGHDWWNVLSQINALDHAAFYASLCFTLGAALMLLSNVWGGYLLWIEFQGRIRSGGLAGGKPQ